MARFYLRQDAALRAEAGAKETDRMSTLLDGLVIRRVPLYAVVGFPDYTGRRRFLTRGAALRGLAKAHWHTRYQWIDEDAGLGYWEVRPGICRGGELLENVACDGHRAGSDVWAIRDEFVGRLCRFYKRRLAQKGK